MKKIILVAETGSDITAELAEKYGIEMVPMHVSFDTETLDDAAFPAQKIVDFYKETGKLPKTSGSTSEDFIKKFDEIHEKYPEAQVLYLAYSAVTTCSFQSANIAAEDRDYVTAIDTKQVSVGRANMCFMPANLEFLRAGGRVSNVAYLGASILGLHPCIELLDGKEKLWIIYTVGISDEVKDVIKETAAECGFEHLEWVQAHGVITTHGGPGAFGIAGFSER